MPTPDKFIYFRADGSKSMGMGHIRRANLIARFVKLHFHYHTILITKDHPETRMFCESQAHSFESIRWIDPQLGENEEILELSTLDQFFPAPSLIFLDILEHDVHENYMNAIRKYKAPLVVITDDSFKRDHFADLMINGNPIQLTYDYEAKSASCLLGPAYFVMDEVYETARVNKPAHDVSKILITVGGTDHHNILFPILDAVGKLSSQISLSIITSVNTGYLEELKKYLAAGHMKYSIHADVPVLSSYFTGADMAITAGGNTLFERIATRLPGLTICQLERQNEIAEQFERLGVNINLGLWDQISEDELNSKLADFIQDYPGRKKQFDKADKLIDGKGLKNIFLRLSEKHLIS